ncbi:MAG: hypothetical protein Q9168_002145 [Polycauliona sp. 1 TL-2023]
MLNLIPAAFYCTLLLLVAFASAVTIEISPDPAVFSTSYLIQRCRNIPPGHCCKPRGEPFNTALNPNDQAPRPPSRNSVPEFSEQPPVPILPNKRIVFTELQPRDLAAVFTGYGDVPGCRGRPKASYNGGGRWLWNVPADEEDFVIEGGHWIRLTLGLPEEPDRGWVEAEGVISMVFENQAWFNGEVTNPASRSTLLNAANAALGGGAGGSGHPLGWKVKRMGNKVVDWSRLMTGSVGTLGKRSIRSPNRGIAFCSAPRLSLWPDVLVKDGVEYTAETPQGSVYVEPGGKALNFTGTAP